eukprot:SAG31_NODE_2023_length_6645_cov_15.211121_2_plen_434_part_00
MRLLLLATAAVAVEAGVQPFGYRSFTEETPGRHINVTESTIFSHQLREDSGDVGMLTYAWIETGNSALDRYVGDNLILRYYVDEEAEAAIVFTPAMGAGSSVGLESADYYGRNASSGAPCSPRPQHIAGPETCGMDLLDGWPWATKWFGKGGAASSWISHMRVPFTSSIRITAQVACGTAETACTTVPPEYRRPDIGAATTVHALTMFRGLQGAETELGVDLGSGAMRLPPVSKRQLRLRTQRRTAANVSTAELVELASMHDPALSGAALMLTVGFDGMRGPLDIEGCWWAVVSEAASLKPGNSTSDSSAALLLGTGVEDLFGNAFGLSWTTKIYHDDNAGLSHVRNGPSPTNYGYPGTRPGASFFSAYRMFDKDPLPFEGRLELWWRNGGPKCGLPVGRHDSTVMTGRTAAPIVTEANRVHSMLWYYTWSSE